MPSTFLFAAACTTCLLTTAAGRGDFVPIGSADVQTDAKATGCGTATANATAVVNGQEVRKTATDRGACEEKQSGSAGGSSSSSSSSSAR